MPIITVISPTRRVGATTAALNLAHGLAITGLHTLLIDFTFSGQCSYLIGEVRGEREPSAETILAAYGDLSKVDGRAIIDNVRPGLDFIPSGLNLAQALRVVEVSDYSDKDYLLVGALQEIGLSYDAVVVDAPFELNLLARNLLYSSDFLVSPISSFSSAYEIKEFLVQGLKLDYCGYWCFFLNKVNWKEKAEFRSVRDRLLLSLEEVKYILRDDFDDQNEGDKPELKLLSTIVSRSSDLELGLLQPGSLFDLSNLNALSEENRRSLRPICDNYMMLVEELFEMVVTPSQVTSKLEEQPLRHVVNR